MGLVGEFGQTAAESLEMQRQMLIDAGEDPGEVAKMGVDVEWAQKTGYQAPAATTSISDVLTGIGAIMGPLAQIGVGIYGAQTQAKLQKDVLKQQQQAAAQQAAQQAALYQQMALAAPAPQSSNTMLIVLASVMGVGALALIVILATRKKKA